MEGRFDWGRYDFGTFRRQDVLTVKRFTALWPVLDSRPADQVGD